MISGICFVPGMLQKFNFKCLSVPAKLTPKSEAPVATSTSDSGGGSGKRKRKIQLVTTNRGDQISLVSNRAAIDRHFTTHLHSGRSSL